MKRSTTRSRTDAASLQTGLSHIGGFPCPQLPFCDCLHNTPSFRRRLLVSLEMCSRGTSALGAAPSPVLFQDFPVGYQVFCKIKCIPPRLNFKGGVGRVRNSMFSALCKSHYPRPSWTSQLEAGCSARSAHEWERKTFPLMSVTFISVLSRGVGAREQTIILP